MASLGFTCRRSVLELSLGREVPEKTGQTDVPLPCDMNVRDSCDLGRWPWNLQVHHSILLTTAVPARATFSRWVWSRRRSGAL